MKESTIERKVVERASKFGWLSFKINSHSTNGLPDRIFMKNKKVFFIEFKTEKGKLSALQKIIRSRLVEQKFEVFVISKIDDIRLNEIFNS